MVRKILCRGCGVPFQYGEADLSKGWRYRDVFLSLNAPVVCDGCGRDLNSQIVIARTEWRGKGHVQPREWEEEFGTVLPAVAVTMHDKLTENKTL